MIAGPRQVLASSHGAHRREFPRYSRGVTLIELMIAIVIVAVLIGIGVPSFRNAALASRLSAVANNLLASAQLARSEAIK